MLNIELGSLQRIEDLHTVWKHEAHDFTKWLSEEDNLKILGDTIGINMHFEDSESPVGDFFADILANEEGTDRRIIIENQLEDTDHKHLGQIITYASGKSANVIIWIVKNARDEHRQAIEWLNQHTDDSICFFLIEIELWKIGNSQPAPKFNIVERPNEWAKVIKSSGKLTSMKQLQYEFWADFKEKSSVNPKFSKSFKPRKPNPHHWYDLAVGSSSYHISLTVSPQKRNITAGIYISDDKELYGLFLSHKEQIEKILDCEVEWREAEKACRFLAITDIDINDHDNWPSAESWLYTKSLQLLEVVKKYDK